ncbi:hypothetical protein NMD1_01232 [Novosphingobium sp. MD-1]|nr:hypothetical protein NMD1_01232 [Novosphingobium sp. MD-1]
MGLVPGWCLVGPPRSPPASGRGDAKSLYSAASARPSSSS